MPQGMWQGMQAHLGLLQRLHVLQMGPDVVQHVPRVLVALRGAGRLKVAHLVRLAHACAAGADAQAPARTSMRHLTILHARTFGSCLSMSNMWTTGASRMNQ